MEFHKLRKKHKYPLSLGGLRSIPRFHTAILNHIYLVIMELLKAVSTCAVCAREDGSQPYICFYGLLLGFKLRLRTSLHRVAVHLRPVPWASKLATDAALDRALESSITVARTDHGTVSAPTVKKLTTVRAHTMALAVMIGNVDVHGIEQCFAGSTPHVARRSASRLRDPVVNGGADDALIDFVRVLYRCERAARKRFSHYCSCLCKFLERRFRCC